ncbi:MAG TPA: hypothetical protein VF649_07445 [Sphingomonas sp.]|jgi:hypothetical protein|uniref:hypothetical protein n=1 Tax=Sphingomonas sp. TaxID=28214 RepID=UPI002ED975F6
MIGVGKAGMKNKEMIQRDRRANMGEYCPILQDTGGCDTIDPGECAGRHVRRTGAEQPRTSTEFACFGWFSRPSGGMGQGAAIAGQARSIPVTARFIVGKHDFAWRSHTDPQFHYGRETIS